MWGRSPLLSQIISEQQEWKGKRNMKKNEKKLIPFWPLESGTFVLVNWKKNSQHDIDNASNLKYLSLVDRQFHRD